MITGTKDTELLVWRLLDDESLKRVIQISRSCFNISQNESFWKERLLIHFSNSAVDAADCVKKSFKGMYWRLAKDRQEYYNDPNLGLVGAVQNNQIGLVKYYLPLANQGVIRKMYKKVSNEKSSLFNCDKYGIVKMFADNLDEWVYYFYFVVRLGMVEKVYDCIDRVEKCNLMIGAIIAIRNHHPKLCLTLTEKYLKDNDQPEQTMLNLLMVYSKGHQEVEKFLNTTGIDFTEAFLFKEVKNGNLFQIREIISKGIHERQKRLACETAIKYGKNDILDELLSIHNCSAALSYAINNELLETVKKITQFMKNHGRSAERFHVLASIRNNNLEMINFLLNNAENDVVSNVGFYLRSACRNGNLETVIFLLERGNVTEDQLERAIYTSAYYGYENIIDYLLSFGNCCPLDRLLENAIVGINEKIISIALDKTPRQKIILAVRLKINRITLKTLDQVLKYVEPLSQEELKTLSKAALKNNTHYAVSFIKERYG